jgi:hypothetical protein
MGTFIRLSAIWMQRNNPRNKEKPASYAHIEAHAAHGLINAFILPIEGDEEHCMSTHLIEIDTMHSLSLRCTQAKGVLVLAAHYHAHEKWVQLHRDDAESGMQARKALPRHLNISVHAETSA